MLSSDDSWFKGIVDTDLSNGHFDNSISTSQNLIEFDRGNNPLDWDAELHYVPRICATALSEKNDHDETNLCPIFSLIC